MDVRAALPTVTCVVTAYNHARFLPEAIGSALAQDYPPELLDVVVVNDGSSDGTRELLDERYADEPRVRCIHQENRGFVGAMNRALGEARGELIAILDGDDAWPQGKLRAQVAVLQQRPEVGLVHGDMEIVDEAGRTLNPSFFAYSRFDVPRGRVLGKLIRQNFVAGGASVVRASLREHFHPIPEELLYPDWYIAARVAERAEIDHVDRSVNKYRSHGANMGLGGTGRKFFSDMRNNVRIQRWMLANLDTSGEPLGDLVAACEAMLGNAVRAAVELDSRATEVLPGGDAQANVAAGREALDACRFETAARHFIRALGDNPWDGTARAELAVCLARRERGGDARALELPEMREAAVLAFADELVADPGLLAAYGREVRDRDQVTLVIHTPPARADELGDALVDAVHAQGLDSGDSADLLLHACDDLSDLLGAPLRAVYTRRAKPSEFTLLPRLDDSTAHDLRPRLGLDEPVPAA